VGEEGLSAAGVLTDEMMPEGPTSRFRKIFKKLLYKEQQVVSQYQATGQGGYPVAPVLCQAVDLFGR
jgi:hypothetical protein